ELDRPYAIAARARGLSESRVLWRHAARTSLPPFVALLALDLGLIITGNVILVEEVFNLPGLGTLVTGAIERSDIPVIEGVVLAATFLMVLANLAADIAFRAL